MTHKDKELVIARLEEYKGDSLGLIAATIEDCQRVVGEMPEEDGWISVSERLPQEDLPVGAVCEVVQVLLQYGEVSVGWCNRDLKCWYYLPINDTRFVGHGYGLTPVVAWKPLSEPPREGA